MITRAIIQSIDYNDNTCLVQMPVFETVASEKQLATATFSIVPGLFNSYKVGDVVYVAFNNNRASQPVVIGKLFISGTDEVENTTGNLSINSLVVSNTAMLPINTKLIAGKGSKTVIQDKSITKYSSIIDIVTTLNSLIKTVASNQTETLKNGTFYCQSPYQNIHGYSADGYNYIEDNETGNCKITLNLSSKLDILQVKQYMKYMTGYELLPVTSYEDEIDDNEVIKINKNKTTYGIIFITTDNKIYCPQWDIESKNLILNRVNE